MIESFPILAIQAEHELHEEHALEFVLSVTLDSSEIPVLRLAGVGGFFLRAAGTGAADTYRFCQFTSILTGTIFALSSGCCLPTPLPLPSSTFFQSVNSITEPSNRSK